MSYKIETKNNIFACTFGHGSYSDWATVTINISANSAREAYNYIKQLHSSRNNKGHPHVYEDSTSKLQLLLRSEPYNCYIDSSSITCEEFGNIPCYIKDSYSEGTALTIRKSSIIHFE